LSIGGDESDVAKELGLSAGQQGCNRLKGFRGIATRYEKTATSYEAAVTLASFLLWARSV